MPYIHQNRRIVLDQKQSAMPQNAGELNYRLTKHLLDTAISQLETKMWLTIMLYCQHRRKEFCPVAQSMNYELGNEIVGALVCCGAEWMRRMDGRDPVVVMRAQTTFKLAEKFYNEQLAPYEDVKMQQNGDVYV